MLFLSTTAAVSIVVGVVVAVAVVGVVVAVAVVAVAAVAAAFATTEAVHETVGSNSHFTIVIPNWFWTL